MSTHRSKSEPAVRREPTTHVATAPNEIWDWSLPEYVCLSPMSEGKFNMNKNRKKINTCTT